MYVHFGLLAVCLTVCFPVLHPSHDEQSVWCIRSMPTGQGQRTAVGFNKVGKHKEASSTGEDMCRCLRFMISFSSLLQEPRSCHQWKNIPIILLLTVWFVTVFIGVSGFAIIFIAKTNGDRARSTVLNARCQSVRLSSN